VTAFQLTLCMSEGRSMCAMCMFVCVCNIHALWLNAVTDRVVFWCEDYCRGQLLCMIWGSVSVYGKRDHIPSLESDVLLGNLPHDIIYVCVCVNAEVSGLCFRTVC